MLAINDMAAQIGAWQTREFGTNKLHRALALCEEAGEVARCVLKTDQAIRPTTRGNLEDEIGDVYICLLGLADLHDIDVEAIVQRRFERLLKFSFKDNVEGTGR